MSVLSCEDDSWEASSSEGLWIKCCWLSIVAYLRDTLAVLAAVEDGPCDTAGVLPLQEERLRLAVLESEDLAVATDVELTL